MTTYVNPTLLAQAKDRLERLQRSPTYRSFFNDAAIEAFSKIEESAYAGTSKKRAVVKTVSPHG